MNDLLNIIDMKINEEYKLTSLRKTPGKDGFENIERLLLSNITNLPMTCLRLAMVVNHKASHDFILLKCKEQTMVFTKRFKMRGNTGKSRRGQQ